MKADAATPAASAVVERYAYDGFGRELPSSPVPSPSSGLNSFRFSTKQLDAETGMNYYGYRFYAANVGRWINRDPIEERGGFNIYEMTASNAVNMVDYLGFQSCPGISDLESGVTVMPMYVPDIIAQDGMAYIVPCSASEVSQMRSNCTGRDGLACSLCYNVVSTSWSVRWAGGRIDIHKKVDRKIKRAYVCSKVDKKVCINFFKCPISSLHIIVAQSRGYPRIIKINRGGAGRNRDESIGGIPPYGGGFDRDEYPPAFADEGGEGASVWPVPAGDNRSSGATIGNQTRGLPDGSEVEIGICF